jgi:hypothetical protein
VYDSLFYQQSQFIVPGGKRKGRCTIKRKLLCHFKGEIHSESFFLFVSDGSWLRRKPNFKLHKWIHLCQTQAQLYVAGLLLSLLNALLVLKSLKLEKQWILDLLGWDVSKWKFEL